MSEQAETAATAPVITITTTVNVPVQRIADMMVGAIEGGSTYWCQSVRLIEPAKRSWSERPWYAASEVYIDPTVRICIETDEGDSHYVGADSFRAALELMCAKYGNHFRDLVGETDDAITADVFLQLVALGDIVYG